eukprot:5734907-Alexandrium_andersonii.AAC.1
MSASLVGSEMCIRDSSRPTDDSHPRRRACQIIQGGRAQCVLAAQTVSYTHLTLPTTVCRSRWSPYH